MQDRRAQPTLEDAFGDPIPLLEVSMALHEEGMGYHSLITTVMQGARDFHPECQLQFGADAGKARGVLVID